MQTIFKYQLEITGYQRIAIPKPATLLCVQMQRDVPCLWALVDDGEEADLIDIYIYGTGQQMIPPLRKKEYLGTFQSGPFVWHVFYAVA